MASFSPLDVYYWPMLGRANSVFRMAEHVGAKTNHISEFGDLAAKCAFGGATTGDNFAPPLVVDGDTSISQSMAIAMYVGEKYGLTEGIPSASKALQHMADIIDLFENGIAPETKKTGEEFKAYLAGDRLAKLMGNIERSIKGPFYYGAQPTYVDFFLNQGFEWASVTQGLAILKDAHGVDFLANYPKVAGVLAALRATPNWNAEAVVAKPDYVRQADDEFFNAFKK